MGMGSMNGGFSQMVRVQERALTELDALAADHAEHKKAIKRIEQGLDRIAEIFARMEKLQ